jgi:hypothetical protein
MKPERQPALTAVELAQGEAVEADIPIGAIFEMRRGRTQYRVKATCEAPNGEKIVSSEIQITY